jgi:hypothetical protein
VVGDNLGRYDKERAAIGMASNPTNSRYAKEREAIKVGSYDDVYSTKPIQVPWKTTQDLTPQPKKYTMDDWDKMNWIDKIKAGIEQKKLKNYDYAPREELYQQEVNKRASSPVGAFSTGLINSASLGTLNVGAEKQAKDMNTLNVISEAQRLSPKSYTVGEIAGYALPAGAGTKLANPLVKNIANPLVKRLAEGALVGAGMTAAQETYEGKPIGQIAKDTAVNTAFGAALDLGFGLPGYIKKANKGILDKAFIDKFGELPKFDAPTI